MAWIESHAALARHPKTLRLAKRLELSIPCTVGHLHMLWWWASEYAQDGSLSPFDDDEIAVACMWEGDAAAFRQALSYAGFVNEDGAIHDWHQYAGKLIERREANAERMRRARADTPSINREARAEHVQRTFVTRAERQDRTRPNQPDPTNQPTTPPPISPSPSLAKDTPNGVAPKPAPARAKAEKKPAEQPTTRAVQAANVILHLRCDEVQREAINAAVPDEDAAFEKWQACLKAWRLRYPNNRGLEGPLDWFAIGIPPKPSRANGHAPPAEAKPYVRREGPSLPGPIEPLSFAERKALQQRKEPPKESGDPQEFERKRAEAAAAAARYQAGATA